MSTPHLVRALGVFGLCGLKPVVENARRLSDMSYSVVGSTVTNAVMRRTFFGHFCGGECAESVKETTDHLQQFGVRSILDYAAEADIETDIMDLHAVGQIHPVLIEESECDANVELFLYSIATAGSTSEGFTAIKVTALGRPALLEKATTIIRKTRELFTHFDTARDDLLDLEEFSEGLRMLGVNMSEVEVQELFDRFDVENSGAIDLLRWLEYLRVDDLQFRPFFTSGSSENALPVLSMDELAQFKRMMERLRRVTQAAHDHKVRLMIDAEQTYFQLAIDHTVTNLQREFNRDFPTVFGTYQAYLKDSKSRLLADMRRAENEGFLFAGKLVRGAYMFAERKRAESYGYEDPIWPAKHDTHRNYDDCLNCVLESIDNANVMVASHNENSIQFAVKRMRELGISRGDSKVFFGQLLGMSDHLSMVLGHHNYAAYKYVPFGPIHEVVPYLVRRVEENSDMLGGIVREKVMLLAELKRRLLSR